jgi:hypothetical protein
MTYGCEAAVPCQFLNSFPSRSDHNSPDAVIVGDSNVSCFWWHRLGSVG